MPGRIHARHFRRLAAHQRAARLPAAFGDPRNDFRRDARLQLSGREIVEEEERLRALRQHIVDAHGNEIDADRLVPAGREGEHQLGANTVRSRNEHGVLEARGLQVEQPAKPAQRCRPRPGAASRPPSA